MFFVRIDEWGWDDAPARVPMFPGDLASLIAQAQQLLPRAIHNARDQELTWTQIGELLGTTPVTAARRYRNNP